LTLSDFYRSIFVIENVWETLKKYNMTDLFIINWTRENVFDTKKKIHKKSNIAQKNMPYLCFLHTFLR
jgi:hypothetical protein